MRKSDIQKFIHSNIGNTFPPDHWLHDILKNHPNYKEKLQNGFRGFKVTPNAIRPQYGQLNVIGTDGSLTSFSWKSCFGYKTNDCADAARHAIFDQVLSKRLSSCERCGGSPDHVHHAWPNFQTIYKAFIASHGKPNKLVWEKPTNRAVIADTAYLNAWRDYHSATANLLTLCKQCHAMEHCKKLGQT